MNEDDYDDEEEYDEDARSYEDEILDWNKYPTFDDIIIDKKSTLLVLFPQNDSMEIAIEELKSWSKTKFSKVDSIESKPTDKVYGFESELSNELLFQIYSDKEKIAIFFQLCNCLGVRFFNDVSKKPIIDYIKKKFSNKFESLFEIKHVEKKFTVEETEIDAVSRTGPTRKNEDLEPRSFWNFYSIKIAGLKGRACLAFPFGS